MSVKPKIDKNKIYIAGRAGELVDYADPLTFSLLEKIFGYVGPYRKVLALFGVGDRLSKESFLVNIYGRVYSDIEVESRVLWNSCLYKLVYDGKSVQLKWSPFQRSFFQGLLGFIKKTLREVLIFSNLENYKRRAEVKYENLSKAVSDVYQEGSIKTREYLRLYESVVYIAYLYDLVFEYNNQRSISKRSKSLQEYLIKYDFSLKKEAGGGMSFTLGPFEEINYRKYDSIPGHIPDFKGNVSKTIRLEAKLQCLKNNIRLKNRILLYFLSKQLKKKAAKFGIEKFDYLTINEIHNLQKIKREAINKRIKKRRDIHDIAQTKRLPNIIVGGKIKTKRAEVIKHGYKGIPCSPGTVEGLMQYIDDPSQEVIAPVVMFPNATPLFTQQFRKARGLIFKVGSPLSHGAIVARELGVPAIALDVDEKELVEKIFRLDGDMGTLEPC